MICRAIIIINMLILFSACAPAPKEVLHISDFWVVYASNDEINQQWKAGGGLGRVKGFYDPQSKTIWVEKGDYHTIGHELRHVTGENWHN